MEQYNKFLTWKDPEIERLGMNTEYKAHWARSREYAYAEQFMGDDLLVLDACCGYVYGFTTYLACHCRHVVGVDLTPQIFTIPQRQNLELHLSDIRAFTYDKPFDRIFCISALEHMGCLDNTGKCNTQVAKEALENMYKLLSPGGMLILTIDHNIDESSLCGLQAREFRQLAYETGFMFRGGWPEYEIPEDVLYYENGWHIYCYTACLYKPCSGEIEKERRRQMKKQKKYQDTLELISKVENGPITWSLCMIVKNEGPRIKACLDSTKDLFDEFCIVDTESTDNTLEVLETYPKDKMKIFTFKWVEDFAAARNFSFSKGTSDYIMWLDADDVLPEESYNILKRIKSDIQTKKLSGDSFMFRYLYGALDFYRLRLVRRTLNFQWEEPVHEFLKHKGLIITIPQVIVQHTREHSNGDRNLKILEKHKDNCSPRAKFYYGRELIENKRFVDAYKILTQVVEDWDGWSEDLINACNLLGHMLQDIPGLKQEVLEVDIINIVQKSFKSDIRPESCYIIGMEYMLIKDWSKAIRWFKLALSTAPDEGTTFGFIDRRYQEFFPALQLAVCYWEVGDYKIALLWHNKSKEFEPNHPSVIKNQKSIAQYLETHKI